MHGMKEIIQEAESLPVEERAMIIDSLLRTMNPPVATLDSEWIKVAKRRLAELRSGAVYEQIKPQIDDEAKALNAQQNTSLSPGVERTRGTFSLRN